MIETYTASWKRGTEGFHKADAQKVAREIMALGDEVTPQQIVDAARDENTELHQCFTWDDSLAAEKWRKHEARLIICHLVINSENKDESKPEIRVFHKTEYGKGYEAAPLIFKHDDEYTI